jgi:hypothetical protein
MWNEAAAWLAKYPEAVVTALDAQGYPYSIRASTSGYDAATGELAVVLPDEIAPNNSAANLLCHRHDESLWNLSVIHLKGVLDRRAGNWVFITTAFKRPPRFVLLDLAMRMRSASRRYLAGRQIAVPEVNWFAVEEIWRNV